MKLSLVFIVLLCFTVWMSTVDGTHGPVTNCCIRWSSTRPPLQRIVDYTIQSEGACPIKAILFRTKKQKTICSDPSSTWARRAMRKVDEEKSYQALQEQGQNEEGSTSNITPAASTTTKKTPQRRNRNRRRRQRKKTRRGRMGQRKRV